MRLGRVAAGALLVAISLAGCSKIGAQTQASAAEPSNAGSPSASDSAAAVPTTNIAPKPTPAAAATVLNQPVPAHRGTIAETLSLSGRVAATREVPLGFSERSTIRSIEVKPGQSVAQDQVLVSADATAIQAQLDAARQRLDADTAALAQARTALEAEQRTASRQAAAAKQTQQDRLAAAQANLSTARANLAKIQAGPPQSEIEAARNAVASAQLAARKAEEAEAKLTGSPDPALMHAAEQRLANAQADIVKAQADQTTANKPGDTAASRQRLAGAEDAAAAARAALEALRNGPDQDALDSAHLATSSAHVQLTAAQARLDAALRGPDPSDLRIAQDAVAQAQAALDRASQPLDPSQDPAGSDGGIGVGQKAIVKDQADMANLQARLAAADIKAPFAGTVLSVFFKDGETTDQNHAVVSLAKEGTPIVRVTIALGDFDKVSIGQPALIQVPSQGADAATINAQVSALAPNDAGTAKVAELRVDWPGAAPKLGSVVNVGLIIQQKSDALIVPKKAVHTAGSRTFVELVDGKTRKVTTVEVGITSSTDAEIVSGLTQGQLVMVGP